MHKTVVLWYYVIGTFGMSHQKASTTSRCVHERCLVKLLYQAAVHSTRLESGAAAGPEVPLESGPPCAANCPSLVVDAVLLLARRSESKARLNEVSVEVTSRLNVVLLHDAGQIPPGIWCVLT